MASELCMNCFHVKGKYEVCPMCGHVEGTPPDQPHYLMPGTILGNHFLVGTAIGAGGFGVTYRCFDVTLGIIVAVKEFYPSGLVNRAPGENTVGLLSGDKKEQYQAQLERFLMEARSIAQFGKAKDIVNVYDFFEENNTAYIIMEYIDGVLVKDYLEKQGRLDPEVALDVISPVINAVKKIHAEGIVHRDISPDNIFISGENSIKVFDFGAAQLNDSSAGMAAEKVIKVGYSAPEQYRDKSKQGFFTDIYSVGAILYQMLTGIKPLESTEREFKDELKSPAELGVKIEPNIDRAVMEAMAVKPELRFQSIQQFEDALESKRVAEYPKVKLKKRKRHRNWIISLTVALVLGVGVFIGLMNTVFKEKSEIFDSTLKEDEITVWVDNEADKSRLEKIIRDGFYPSENTTTSSEDLKKMRADNEKKITVQVVNVSEDGSSMESKLAEAKEQSTMPDMFLSDRVRNLEDYPLISLKNTVYDAIDTEKYLYMDTYPKYCRGMKEMPTGINSMFLYGIQFDPEKSGKRGEENETLADSGFYAAEAPSVEIESLIARNTGQNRQEFTMVEDGYSTKAGILTNTSCFVAEKGELSPDTDLVENLYHFAIHMRQESKLNPISDRDSSVTGNSVLAGVEYRKEMEAQKSEGIGDSSKKNRVTDYSVKVVTHNGKMLVNYEDKFAISAESSKNKQTACMRLLLVCLLESSQKENFSSTGGTPFPILKSAFDEFFEYNSGFNCFKEMTGSSAYLIGDGQAEIVAFDAGICALSDKSELTQRGLLTYCTEYTVDKKKRESARAGSEKEE